MLEVVILIWFLVLDLLHLLWRWPPCTYITRKYLISDKF